jgi:death-on-curing protein
MLPLTPEERARFTQADTDSRLASVELLVVAAIFFSAIAVTEFGGHGGGVRARGLVEQVIGAAFQTYGLIDPHPGPFDKAAMLLRGITLGHPFNDGNKRTGFLVAAYYLEAVGIPVPVHMPVEAAVDLCLRVSAGELREPEAITGELRSLWTGDYGA